MNLKINIKVNILRAVLIALLIILFGIIFGFSNQNGEKSGGISRKITETVTKNINWIQELEEAEKEITLKKIEKVVRKLAHFSIYTALGVVSMSLMSTYDLKQRNRCISSFAIGFLYASSDEIHQSFIPGRSPAIMDVFIDSCGVIFRNCNCFAFVPENNVEIYEKKLEIYVKSL